VFFLSLVHNFPSLNYATNMQKSGSLPLVHCLHLLRLPLLLNNLIALILAFICLDDVFIAQGVFHILSICLGLAILIRHRLLKKRQQAILLDDDHAVKFHASFLKAMVDTLFGITFLVLYVIGTVSAGGRWYGPELHVIYTTFGALIACVFHFSIAVAEFHLWWRHCRAPKLICPHCNSQIGGSTLPNNRLEARGRDAKIDFEALVNESGDAEADRLILNSTDL